VKALKAAGPTNIDWHEEGRRLTRAGHHRKAIQAFNLAIDQKIKFGESYFKRGLCHYRLGNYRQAKDDLEAAALLGCINAQLWGKHDRKRYEKSDEE
jgi:tetratricopeptide (TPR) repeat protein